MKQRKLLLVGILMLSVLVFAGCGTLRLLRYVGFYKGTVKLKPSGSSVELNGKWQFEVKKSGSLTGRCLIEGMLYDNITGVVNADGSFTGSWQMKLNDLPVSISFTGNIEKKDVTGTIKIGELKVGTLEGKKVSVLEQLLP